MTAEDLVAFAESLARIAATGGGATALAAQLARRTGVGVLVEDAQWRRLAAAGPAAGVPGTVRDLLAAAAAPTPSIQRLMDGRAGRALSIRAGEAHLGYLSIFPSDPSQQPADGEFDTLEHAMRLTASAIALELARGPAGGRGSPRTFWEQLEARAYHDATAARDDAAARGIVLATHYVAIDIEPEGIGETRVAAARAEVRSLAREAFHSGEADLGALERGASLLFFVPCNREIDAANARTAAALLPRGLAKRAEHLRIGGGVGNRVPLLSLHRSIEQAAAALAIARRIFGTGRVAVYDDLGAYPLLLEGAATPALQEFARRTLAPLRAYDEKHQTELERTLKRYFAARQNVKVAAAELNVHRHTVLYRLRQINEICSCTLDDIHDQLTFRMAVAIDALNG